MRGPPHRSSSASSVLCRPGLRDTGPGLTGGHGGPVRAPQGCACSAGPSTCGRFLPHWSPQCVHPWGLRVPLLLRWGNSDAPWERELPGRAPDLLSCSGVSRGLRPTPSGPITAQAPCSLPALPRPRLGAAAPRLDRVPLQGSVPGHLPGEAVFCASPQVPLPVLREDPAPGWLAEGSA